jgi:demethylmenaquinone methyltransferase/2-methoxy-6-polyprenyl-1,4-benzoquinol methylase
MEFSPEISSLLNPLYKVYSFSVLPWLGETIANDRAAYQYLAESIRQFPDPENLKSRMSAAGFKTIRYEKLLGGIAVIHSGRIS